MELPTMVLEPLLHEGLLAPLPALPEELLPAEAAAASASWFKPLLLLLLTDGAITPKQDQDDGNKSTL